MATLYLRPNAVGDETTLTPHPGAGEANWEDVDEETPDEDATYVAAPVNTEARDLYNLDDTSQTGTINWIKVWIRCKSVGAAELISRTVIKTGGTAYESADTATTGSYADYSTQYTEKPGGGAWTFGAVLNALQAGVWLYTSGGKDPIGTVCTQVYIEVDYTAGQTYEVSCSDGVKMGDSPVANLILNLSLSDGLKQGDAPSGRITAQVLASDGFKVGDSSVIGGTYHVYLQDGFLVGDITQWANNIYEVLAEDGFKVGDTALVQGIFQVLASDGFKIGDSTLAQKILSLILSDGFKLGDLPKGQIVTSLTLSDGFKMGDAVVITSPGTALKDAMVKPTRKPRIWIYIG